MTSLNGYPVRGLLEQVRLSQCNIYLAEEIINHYIDISKEKGYSEGVVDTLKQRSDALRTSLNNSTTPQGISVRAELNQ